MSRQPFLSVPLWLSMLCISLLVVSCATLDPGPQRIETSPGDSREYRHVRLDNGLEAVVVSEPSTEVTAVSLSVGVGSYQNPPAFPGLAHYLEHMLFLGTENYPEPNNLQKYLKENAGYANAYTSSTHTNYFFQVPFEKLDPALDRFSDYFKNPLFDIEYSEKELNAVHSEWSMSRDQDRRILYSLSGLTAHSEHPATHLSVGNKKTLRDQPDLSLNEAMLAFYDKYYSANIMKLVMVGKQSLDEQEALVRKHFSGVENNNVELPEVTKAGLTETELGKHIYYHPQKDLKQLVLEFAIPDNSDQWRLKPNEYLVNLISSEEPGTLGQKLREWDLADQLAAQAEPDYYDADGIFRINIDLTEKGVAEQDQVIAAVLAYLDLIRDQGVNEAYFEELKALQQRRFDILEAPQPMQQAAHLSASLFELPVPYIISAPYRYERFDEEAIRQVLARMTPENLRVWHVNQQVEGERDIPHHAGRYSMTDITEADRQRWQELAARQALQLPEENEFAGAGQLVNVEASLEEMTLVESGPNVEAWLMHAEHHQGEKGFFHLVFNNDLGEQSIQHYIMGCLLNDLFKENSLSLIDRAGRASIEIDIDRSGENLQNLTLSGPSGQHPELVDRLANNFVNLEFEQEDFDKAMAQFREWVAGQKRDAPYQQLFRHRERLVSDFPWRADEILAASDTVDPAGLRQYHRQVMDQSTLYAYSFGNYAPETVSEMVQSIDNKLGTERDTGPIHVDDNITPQAGAVMEFREAVEHTDAALLESFYLPRESVAAQAQLQLLNGLFGNAFYTELRTNQQLGYVVGSSPAAVDQYPEFVLFVQSPETPLPDIKASVDEFRRGYLEQLEAVEPQVFDQLKQGVIAQFTQKPNDFQTEARRHLSDFYRHNTDFDSRDKMLAALEEATKEDLVALYQELLLGDKAARMVLQLKGTNFAEGDYAPVEKAPME